MYPCFKPTQPNRYTSYRQSMNIFIGHAQNRDAPVDTGVYFATTLSAAHANEHMKRCSHYSNVTGRPEEQECCHEG